MRISVAMICTEHWGSVPGWGKGFSFCMPGYDVTFLNKVGYLLSNLPEHELSTHLHLRKKVKNILNYSSGSLYVSTGKYVLKIYTKIVYDRIKQQRWVMSSVTQTV
jgi:hypothetical protein